MKVCNYCHVEQPETAFRPQARKCRKCTYETKLIWEKNNPDKMKEMSRRNYRNNPHLWKKPSEWTAERRDAVNARRRELRNTPGTAVHEHRFGAGREKYLAAKRAYNQRSKSNRQKYNQARWRNDTNYRLKRMLRRYVIEAVILGSRTKRSMELLGCSIESFRMYLESKFTEGMSWNNYGKTGWEIDHIMPCAIFDLTKPEHQKRAFHFSNMQPLWAQENRAKSDKVLTNQFPLL